MLILLRGAFFLALIGLWIWCVFDVIRTEAEPRYLHKLIWLAFVVLIPTIGSLGWLFLGRPEPIGQRFIPQERPSAPPPDDSPEFLARLDEEIKRKRRSEELRRKVDQTESSDLDDQISQMEKEFRKDEEDGGAKS